MKLRTAFSRWWLTYAPQPVWTVGAIAGDWLARVAYLFGRRTPCRRVGFTRSLRQSTSAVTWCVDYKGHRGRHTWADESR